jgi:hypothetical protein
MDSKILVAALAALLSAAPAFAQDAKPAPTQKQSIMTFFKHLKESLSQSAVSGQRKKAKTGAVAAVRGEDQKTSLSDPNETTLKGDPRVKKEKAVAAEDAEFAAAVELVLQNKPNEGVQALEAFKLKHPKSHNLDDVQKAIEQAKMLSAAPADAPKTDAPKAETQPAAPAKN